MAFATAAVVTIGTVFLAASLMPEATDHRRVNCSKLTVFAPQNGKSEEELCKSHGGLALSGSAPAEQGLVILVRNLPMGGFSANTAVR
ncbi:hypothetical protein [Roseibium sp. RKSG952]|uniref:hypothetical protein n=1 Tax=Roseibium sp. RKSG952 TaxID=2529384 RepID=UPI001AD8FB5B|nr:hypothetical protein [Roseibium sp. RKSG952]